MNRQLINLFLTLTIVLHFIKGTAQNPNMFYTNSWALIIGIDNYENNRNLHYAVSDAEKLQTLLTKKMDFPEDNVFLLKNNDATLLNIKKKMAKLSELVSENDRVIIYFAGHGITEPLPKGGKEGYLLPVDGDKEDPFTTALPMSEMKRLSNRVPAKDMLFLMDACYSGLMGIGSRGIGLEEKSPNTLKNL